MKAIHTAAALALVLAVVIVASASPTAAGPRVTRTDELRALGLRYQAKLATLRGDAYQRMISLVDGPQGRLNRTPGVQLMYVNERGVPVFNETHNLDAAKTVGTSEVWPGGSGGFNLSGAGTELGKLGIWDGGGVLTTHREYAGRVVQEDSPAGTLFHATHVAGTMIASGVDPQAKGMSYEATLAAYDWNNDDAEMAAAAAAGMNVSNHSYGYVAGWRWDQDWYWSGDTSVSPVEDYGFGYYSDETRALDEIAWNAPYYTIVKSAGNDRAETGPGPGGGHWVWQGNDWAWSTETRDPDGGADGYDTIPWKANAKDIITVGAIDDIVTGYRSPTDVVMTYFSSWGPTDDGRIKPDLVANGVGLYSATDTGDADYARYSGTSMAAPNLSGSLNLLVREYESTHGGETPLASTMKAVLIETADEAGPAPGPDYMYGWGLLNTLGAATLISDDGAAPGWIREESLADGATDEYYVEGDGASPIRVTLAWTDPPGPHVAPALDPPDIVLVNDLDLRVTDVATGTVYLPYVLDPADPSAAATAGDNFRDNVEQVVIEAPEPGEYVVTVSHKGTLAEPQAYSLASSAPTMTSETGVGELGREPRFQLLANYPNPFNPSTTIAYELPAAESVSLKVYNAAGRLVRTLEDGTRNAGRHEVRWDGTDTGGRSVASGLYYYRLEAGGEARTRPMVLLK
jgi:hypothetical protein